MNKTRSKPLNLIILGTILTWILFSCSAGKVVSIKSLLVGMTDKDCLTRLPSPDYSLRQFSSYDRRSDSIDGEGWFANDDYTQFSGIDSSSGRKEYILFDTDGPGTVVRWWMTFAGAGANKGIVRVYIDNNPVPVLEDSVLRIVGGDLLTAPPLSTSVSPLTDPSMRGYNLYLPLPYSQHCRITYQCDSIRITSNSRKPSIYYNICYRTYTKGTRVVSLSKDELINASVLIKKTNELLLKPDSIANSGNTSSCSKNTDINGVDSTFIEIRHKNSAICKISLKLKAFDTEYALRSTVLKITFDGIQTIWVPAGDFFGTAYKKTTSSTWESCVDDSMKMESYWLMPFRRNCVISLVNYGNQVVKAEISVKLTDYKWNKNSMYFGASWHEYHQIITAGAKVTGGSGMHRDINFANIRGQGVYAGDAVAVFNTVDAWWGEGDEKIFVDGESFPSSIGTGTEDYYGYAWCRPELFSHPFIAQPSGSGNFHPGLTINIRYRNLDAIPFRSSISSNIELWHWLPAVINYALTTYWYVKPPYEINIKPDPVKVAVPIPVDPEKPL